MAEERIDLGGLPIVATTGGLMLRRLLIGTALLAVAALSPASADTLFVDNFNTENGGAGVLNYTGFANFGVLGGTVDLIGNGLHGGLHSLLVQRRHHQVDTRARTQVPQIGFLCINIVVMKRNIVFRKNSFKLFPYKIFSL